MERRINLTGDYSISKIINGGWQLAKGHALILEVDYEDAMRGLFSLADRGFTTFDCADIYTGVEDFLGNFRKRYLGLFSEKREIQIHTKFVPDMSDLSRVDRKYVEAVIDRSLTRLGVERLDLVQFHWWDYDIPGYVDTALILKDLQKAGKIRLIGTTNFDVPHLKALTDAGVPIATNQIQYSLFDRRPEHGMADFCAKTGVKLLCYGSIAGGFISERWIGQKRPAEFENRSLVKYSLIIDEFGGWDAFQELLVLLGRIAAKRGVTIPNVAQAWVLSRAEVAAVIVGVRSARHVADAEKTFGVSLDSADLHAIDSFLASHPGPEGDTYFLERIKGGRHASILKTNLSKS